VRYVKQPKVSVVHKPLQALQRNGQQPNLFVVHAMIDRHGTIAQAAYADLLSSLRDKQVAAVSGTPRVEDRPVDLRRA
jgi:hypothetical protein